jgi:hypothetical protein
MNTDPRTEQQQRAKLRAAIAAIAGELDRLYGNTHPGAFERGIYSWYWGTEPDEQTLHRSAADALGFLADTQARRCYICGHDIGGEPVRPVCDHCCRVIDARRNTENRSA